MARALLALWTLGCNGDVGKPPTPTNEAEPYCFALKLPRAEVALGDPVLAEVELRNCSEETQSPQDLLAPEYGMLRIEIEHPDGETRPWWPVVLREGRGAPRVKLAPDQPLRERLPLYLAKGGWVLREAGRYRISAAYAVASRTLRAEVALLVREPEGPAELDAALRFMEPEVARAFYLGGAEATDPKGPLVAFAMAKNGTRTARYARLGIALAWSEVSAERCADAAAEAEVLATDLGDSLRAADAARSAARCPER